MLICPKCKCEYREGFKVCTDCGVELVEDNYICDIHAALVQHLYTILSATTKK